MKSELAIGPAQPVLVIAEIGVNHDGSIDRAIELVRAAAAAGADALKLQLFQADRLMHGSTALAEYQKSSGRDASAIDMLRQYELSDDAVRQVAAEAESLDLWLLATPFSPGDLALIESLNVPAIKIASPDLVNKPLLRAAAELGRPLLVSTGAAKMSEVEQTAAWLREWKAPFALLHCISSYPTPAGEAHLSWIGELIERFGVPVGMSDHTTELSAGAFAVAAGARLIEKHLTWDRSAPGPDHAASSDPTQFAEYVRLIRLADTMLGKPGKRVLPIEEDVRRVSRQSVVLARSVPAGAKLLEKDLTTQRPGNGIPAADMEELIGLTVTRPLARGEMFQWDMVVGR